MNSFLSRLKHPFWIIFHCLVTFYENGTLPQAEFLARYSWGRPLIKIWKIIQVPLGIPLRYLRDTWFEDNFSQFKLVADLWKSGWLGRAELLTGLLGGLAVPAVFFLSPENAGITPPVLITGLVVYALAYSLALAAACHLSFPFFVLTGIYLIWYMFYIGGSLAGTLPFALPSLWLLVCGELHALAEKNDSKYGWLALLCVVASYLTYGAMGFRTLFIGAWEGYPILTLSLLYFLVTALPLFIQRNKPLLPAPSSGFIFSGTLLITALYFYLAFSQDFALTADYALLSVRGLLGIVDLFWMWLGATLVESALDMGDWWTGESVGLLTKRLFVWLIPIFWAGFALFGWITTWVNVPGNIILWASRSGLYDWVLTWDDSLYFSVKDQVYVSLAILVILLVIVILKRQSMEIIGILNGLWIASFMTLLGFYESFQGFATLEEDALPPTEAWLVIVLVFGLVWEMTQAGEGYWESENPGKHLGISALLAYMLAICVLTLGAGYSDLVAEYTFYSFNGIIYLGIPMLGYLLLKRLGIETLEKSRLIVLVGLGALSAAIPFGINPWGDWSLLFAPFVWFLILFFFGKKLARLATWVDALVAGSALSMGFVTFWMSPEVIPVPFLGFIQDFQDRYLTLELNRPFLLEGQIWITLAALGAGLITGALVYFSHKSFPQKQSITE